MDNPEFSAQPCGASDSMMSNPAPTYISDDGRTLSFSCEDFISRICKGDACFICGASPESAPFNDEHIVPRWVLRRYGLFEKEITLPTRERRRYGGYRVPCCVSCNSLLGDKIETPVSKLLTGDFHALSPHITDERTRELVFTWLSILFLKTHLKDAKIPVHKDRRRGNDVIGDLYDWGELHHLHAIARTPYTRAALLPGVVGSLFFVEVNDATSSDGWDFVDLSFAQTIAVRVGNIGIVAVFNDAGAAESAWSHRLEAIDGPIAGAQFRELAAMFAVANDDILVRPSFGSLIIEGRWLAIYASVPRALEMAKFDPEKFGHALLFALGNTISTIEVDGCRDPSVVSEKIKTGRVRFLTDELGNFRRQVDVVRDYRATPSSNPGSE